MNRRIFLSASVLPLISLGGCATAALYEQISAKDYKDYEEPVRQILVSSDGKKIVVLGETFHYVFDAPGKLVEILDSPLHRRLSAVMHRFNVTPDAEIKGSFLLMMPNNADDEDQKIARSYGFKGASTEGATLSFELIGKRYSAKGFMASEGMIKRFNQPYSVSVREELPSRGKAALVLLTPITVAADGALVLLGVALAPVAGIALGFIGNPMPMVVR